MKIKENQKSNCFYLQKLPCQRLGSENAPRGGQGSVARAADPRGPGGPRSPLTGGSRSGRAQNPTPS